MLGRQRAISRGAETYGYVGLAIEKDRGRSPHQPRTAAKAVGGTGPPAAKAPPPSPSAARLCVYDAYGNQTAQTVACAASMRQLGIMIGAYNVDSAVLAENIGCLHFRVG